MVYKLPVKKNLSVPLTTVMDNAPYNSVVLGKPLTMATRKEDIINWLLQQMLPQA